MCPELGRGVAATTPFASADPLGLGSIDALGPLIRQGNESRRPLAPHPAAAPAGPLGGFVTRRRFSPLPNTHADLCTPAQLNVC
jgi:hypothetical protein